MARLSIKGKGWQNNRRTQQDGYRRQDANDASDGEEESSSENASGIDETGSGSGSGSDSEQSDESSTGPSKERDGGRSADEPSDVESDGPTETLNRHRAGVQARMRNSGQKPVPVSTAKRPRQTSDEAGQDSDRDSEEDEDVKSAKNKVGRPVKARSLTTKQWRHYAKQERDLICRRGGLIWQAARPLLEEMSATDRSAAATALREMTRSLDARMQTALVPGTIKLPGRLNGSTAMNEKDYRPTLSSLMSWVLSTGGTLPSYDDEDDDDDNDAADFSRASNFATTSEQPKGFEADKRVLEELLMPEINGLISLQRASEAQDRELELAKRELDRLQQASDLIENKSEAVRENLSALLRDAMARTQDHHQTSNSLDKMLRSSSGATLGKTNE